jgi:hypothetical protein
MLYLLLYWLFERAEEEVISVDVARYICAK